MTLQRTLVTLTAINFAILVWLLAGPQLVSASGDAGVLRRTALQIVDSEGRIRASIGILPQEAAPNGTTEETVLLRLINAEGQPSVKIGVSAAASAMSLVGGDDESYIVVEANGPDSVLKLVGPQGETRTIGP
jgi:hypothetical protein